MKRLIPLKHAQKILLEQTSPLPAEIVRLNDGGGRVLAEEIRASRDEPPAAQATMDGYAVKSGDVDSASLERSIFLTVVGTIAAGQSSRRTLNSGEAFRVMTGAALPDGSDAVVPQEMTESFPQGIGVRVAVAPGSNLMPAGAEINRNERLISSGAVLQARELTILATQGSETVKVRRQPVVAILATGSELKEVGESLDQGELFASNLYTLSQLVKCCGGIPRPLGIVGDDLNTLSRTIRKGGKADLVVTTGGTGKGDKDLLTTAITTLAGRLLFAGVSMSPGKQTLAAAVNQTLLVGLPGRPPASYIAFQQLVRPLVLRMLGVSAFFLPEINARLRHSVRSKVTANIVSFLFSRLTLGANGPEVASLRSKRTGILTEMLAANSLIKMESGKTRLERGEAVRVQPLDLGLEGLSYFADY